MTGNSWTHRLARLLVRPLIGTGVTPNQPTALRLVTGLAACAALVPGGPPWTWWAGALWLASAFLDRADGELARIGGMATPGGHAFDFLADNIVNAAIFVAMGLALRHAAWGGQAMLLGLWTGTALFVCGHWSEWLERRELPGTKAYAGAFGFDPDDLLYLLTPMIWLGWLAPLLIGAGIGATIMMLLTGWRLRRLILRQERAEEAE